MRKMWPALLFWSVVVVGIVGMALLAQVLGPGKVVQVPSVTQETTMPARFEGQGAFTLGCALWQVPQVESYGADNPRTEYLQLVVVGDKDNPPELLAIVDGPQGTVLLSGTHCAVSIDWSAFPKIPRAVPVDPAPGMVN